MVVKKNTGTITVQVETKVDRWIYHPVVFYPLAIIAQFPFTKRFIDFVVRKAIHVRVW